MGGIGTGVGLIGGVTTDGAGIDDGGIGVGFIGGSTVIGI